MYSEEYERDYERRASQQKSSNGCVGCLGVGVLFLAVIGALTYTVKENEEKKENERKSIEDMSATYLGYKEAALRSRFGKYGSYIKLFFDTDNNPQTYEVVGDVYDDASLFKAGISLKGKEGQIMKISEWKKKSGLENMSLYRVENKRYKE